MFGDFIDDEDEELRLALAMSLSVENSNGNNNNNNDNNNGNDNNNNDNNNNDDNKGGGEEEQKEEEAEKTDDYDNENNIFVKQFTTNCIYSRALTGTYESDHILDEILPPKEGENEKKDADKSTTQVKLLDTSSEKDESKRKLIESKDIKLILSLPYFTRLIIQNLNEAIASRDVIPTEFINFTFFLLKAYNNAIKSSTYLFTRDLCPLSNPQKLNKFFVETINILFETMNKYTLVLEVNDIRSALLEISTTLFIENNSISSVCNILSAAEASEMNKIVSTSGETFLNKKLVNENSELKNVILKIISSNDDDNNENSENEYEIKDFYNDNINAFINKNGLENVLDYVQNKFARFEDESENEPSEIEDKKQKTEEEEGVNNDDDGDNIVNEQDIFNDFYANVLSFMKFFSRIYGIANKNEMYNDRMKVVNDKLFTITSAIVIQSFNSETYIPPFSLFLAIFKIFSDGFKIDVLNNLKIVFAYNFIKSFNEASKKDNVKWAEHPLSNNTQTILTYATKSLVLILSSHKKLCSVDSPEVSAIREKIDLAFSSASNGEFKHLNEVLDGDVCTVLSAFVLPKNDSDEHESIIDVLITTTSILSKDLAFIKEGEKSGEAASKEATTSTTASSSDSAVKSEASGTLFDLLFKTDSSQDGLAGDRLSCCAEREDNLCRTCVIIYNACRQLIGTISPVLSANAIDSLIAFAQNISPNDNIVKPESAAFAKNIKNDKNYHKIASTFREFTKTLIVADNKNGGKIGEAITKRVFEKFPLFGPLECVLVSARFWSLKKLRLSTDNADSLPIAIDTLNMFIEALADKVLSGDNTDYLEVVSYERAEEILFMYNYCLNKESRVKLSVSALTKLSKVATEAKNIKCPERLIALGRLIGFATYFATFVNKAPTSFALSVSENILERRLEGTPADEAFPYSVITDKNIIFEHAPQHLELIPYYFFNESKEDTHITDEPIIACILENMPLYAQLTNFEFDGCDSRLKNYYTRIMFAFFMNSFATNAPEKWIKLLLEGNNDDFKPKSAILLMLINEFADTDSVDLVKVFVEKAFDALSNEEGYNDDNATFGLLLFILSVIETCVPTKKDVSVAKRESFTSLLDSLPEVNKKNVLTADELVAQVTVPVEFLSLPTKIDFEWDTKLEVVVNLAKRLLAKYLALIGGKDADKLKAFIYSGLSLNDEVATTLLPKVETFRKKFSDVAILPPLEQKEGVKASAKDTLLYYVLSLSNEKDKEIAIKINLNMAALLITKLFHPENKDNQNSMQLISKECIVLDNFRFANYGVFLDSIIRADKKHAKSIASELWKLFTKSLSSSSKDDSKAFGELLNNDNVLEKFLTLYKSFPNKKALYNFFIVYNSTNIQKIVSALLKDGSKKTTANKKLLVEAIKENGLSPEDDAVVQSILQKLLVGSDTDSINFITDIAKSDSDKPELNSFSKKVYTAMLNIADNKEAIGKITPKTYFKALQTVSFNCNNLIPLFNFSIGKLRAANTAMKVEGDEKSADDTLVYPYISIIQSIIRMLEYVNKKDSNTMLDPEEEKVRNALDKMAKNMPYWGCHEKDPRFECTFLKTGKNFVDQLWYHCKTCGLTGGKGCCQICAIKCHKGHDLALGKISSFYCDCGAGSKCKYTHAQEDAGEAMEVEKASTSTFGNAGLYDPSKLDAEYATKLKAEVFNQETFNALHEYFSSHSASFIKGINKEVESAEEISTDTTVKISASPKEKTETATVLVRPTPRSLSRPSNLELTENIKSDSFSFTVPRINIERSHLSNPTSLGTYIYAVCTAQFRKDSIAVVSRDSLKILAAKELIASASQKTLATIDLPFSPIGISVHPVVQDVVTLFNSYDCYVLIFEPGSQSKVLHKVPITLPQDDEYYILNAFWIPVQTVTGPFLCIVTRKGILVYDVTNNLDEPALSYKNKNIIGAVCVKSDIYMSSSQIPSVKAVFVAMTTSPNKSELFAVTMNELGTEKVSVQSKKIVCPSITDEQVGIFYAQSSGFLLLSSIKRNCVTGYSVTVSDDNSTVLLGEKMAILSYGLLCITESVVDGIAVITSSGRDRMTAYTVVLGSDRLLYSQVPMGRTISGISFIKDENSNNTYLLIIQSNSRIGISTISKRRIEFSSPLGLEKARLEGLNKPKSVAKEEPVEVKKAKIGDPITYAYLPRSAPELGENSVYAMIRGEDKDYVIDGDLSGEMSSASIRNKLKEPENCAYGNCGVVSLKRGEFKLRVINKNNSLAITGLQIGLAHSHKSNVPEYITVFNRRITVPDKPNYVCTIVFTLQEVLCAQNYVSIHFGPSKGGLEKIFVDYITPFFMEKKDFGLSKEDWPTKRSVITVAGGNEAHYSLSTTTAASGLISSLRAVDATLSSSKMDNELPFIETIIHVFTAVPGKISERFHLLDIVEGRIKKSPAFVGSVVKSFTPIIEASKSDNNDNSRSAQLCAIAGFLKKVLNSELNAAFDPVIGSNIIGMLCEAVQTIKNAGTIKKSGIIQSIISLIFTAQVAALSRNSPNSTEYCKTLTDNMTILLMSENSAIRNECSHAICTHFNEVSDGYKVSVEPAEPSTNDFTTCLREYSAQYNNDAELLLAIAKHMSLATKSDKVAPGNVVKSVLCFAPNTVDFCVLVLQNMLNTLPAVSGHKEAWDGRFIPILFTILHLAVRTIRATSLCRPRKYVADLCHTVVQSLLPAPKASEFLNKELMAGLPSTSSCYAVLRIATVASIVRECSRSSSPDTHEAVKWMIESIPEDFPQVLYEFMNGTFDSEYEKFSRQPSGSVKLNVSEKTFIPPAVFNIKHRMPSENSAANATAKESWKPLLADIFIDAFDGPSSILSFLYSKRLFTAILYLARKVSSSFNNNNSNNSNDDDGDIDIDENKTKVFDEERWAVLIGRNMVQSRLKFAYPSLFKLAQSILSSETALFSQIDKVNQTKFATFIDVLYAKTEHFARAPSADDQGRLLDLLYTQLSVATQRPWSWRAHGLNHQSTATMLYKLAIAYTQNRRVRKDIVSISLSLLGMLMNEDNQNESVLSAEAANCINDNGQIAESVDEFIELFVIGSESNVHQLNDFVRDSAAKFVSVLLATKSLSKVVSSVVLSFLDDVVSGHPSGMSEYYMDIVANALTVVNNDGDDNDDGDDDDGSDRELKLLEAFDTHIKKMATYPEASSIVKKRGGVNDVIDERYIDCPLCDAHNVPIDYTILSLCTRDMIQVLPTSTTFMFSTSQNQRSLSSLFVDTIGVALPRLAKDIIKEVTISVAYKPPVVNTLPSSSSSSSSQQITAVEPKWTVVTKLHNFRSIFYNDIEDSFTLGCGLHIVGIKVELSSAIDENNNVFVCPNCDCSLSNLVCKKCKSFARETMIWVNAGPVTLVKDRLSSEEGASGETKNLLEKLSGVTVPTFLPK